MIVKLLTEHHLEFLSLKGGCSGSAESTHVYSLVNHTMLHANQTRRYYALNTYFA